MVFDNTVKCIHEFEIHFEIWNLYTLGICHVSKRLLYVPYFHEKKTVCWKTTIAIYILRIGCISYWITMSIILSGQYGQLINQPAILIKCTDRFSYGK